MVDELSTHQSEELVKVVGEKCSIELELDEQGRLRTMKAMGSRAKLLADLGHRIRFVYIPKHTSWLNQVELWFSILVRKLLKRGSFTSVQNLRERILGFY